MKAEFDPARINAVVLLTDGRNEDTYNDLNATIAKLRAGCRGPVLAAGAAVHHRLRPGRRQGAP